MKKILIFLSMILAAKAAFAQAAPSLLVPADARGLALGGVQLPSDASKLDVRAFYGMWAPKTAGSSLIGADVFFRAGEKVALSVEGRTLMDKPYEITTGQGQVLGAFRPNDLIVGLGVRVTFTDAISVGVKARMISSSIAEQAKGTAFGGDLDVAYTGEIFRVSLGARNLGSKLSYGGTQSYALPGLAALQGSVSPVEGLTVAAEVDYLFQGGLMAGLGVEYTIVDIVSLRGGFHYGDAAKAVPMYASLGLGVKFAGVHLDAAFLLASKTLGNTLMVGLGYAF